MGNVIEEITHAYWGVIRRREGYDDWDLEELATLPDGDRIRFRFVFDDPNDPIVQANHTEFKKRWEEVWSRILDRVQEMKSDYGYSDVPINPERDWFYLRLPKQPLGDNAWWSVMLQADEAGWLLDFVNWEDHGGQGVF